MIIPDTPKDGDFASYLEARRKTPATVSPGTGADHSAAFGAPIEQPRQTIQQVLVDGEEPTEEFLEELNALENAPELSDEELAQQALNAPGEDGDTRTPE
jgi:hypothetical protein